MVKIVILIKKKPGMSREDFIDYYENNHSPLGKELVGHLWTKYVRNYPQSIMEYQPEAVSLDGGYDAITEIWLKDEAAMEEMARIVNIPENNRRILEDEENFQDRLHTRMMICDEYDTGIS